ncbi:Ig-like domain-containing protein [Flavobacterium hungaricum]|nr:Ig-like domain-containing protein [Flavobacterium hungaricum]
MIKNYFTLNRVLNLQKTIILFFVFFVFSQVSNAQCAIPVQGCSGTNLSNFGADSNNDASSIEYDNFISSFHSTIVRTSDGSLQVWGEKVGNDGTTNVMSPLTINKANFTGLNSGVTVLKAALGSNSTNGTQGIVLATDGLYAWGTRGAVLANSIGTSSTFQKIAIGSNANGLPTGVNPSDVKMMFATYKTLAITTCSGDLWVISQTASVRGNGGTGDALNWYRVTTSETGNPFLTNVVVCRGSLDGLMALKSDGTVYVWGSNVYLGDSNPVIASQTTAARMTLPGSITPKMIGSTCNRDNQRSYYILATNSNLYSLGSNVSKQLGDWTTNERRSWVQPRYTSTTGLVMDNIRWISVQEHDTEYGAINVINTNYNLYAFGQNDNRLLGGGSANSVDPLMPAGVAASDKILAVETGGHTSMIVKACEPRFGYVGHRINGSMGSGPTATTGTENSFNFATANVQICGAESNPVIQPISLGGGPDSKYCIDDPVLLNPTPAGGTLTLVSGPGTLSGNTLTFTGVGTVQVRYTVTTSCGGTTVTNRTFEGVLCPADLEITKVANSSTPSVGNNVIFTITAKNNGLYKATGVTVNDVLPSGYTFVSATPSVGTWTAPNWTVGSLASGASATLQITGTVRATGSYANTATVSGNNPDGTAGNNSATSTPLVQTNLSVTKTVDNTTPNVGSDVTFTITASNAGPSTATGVTVTDNLPSGYTFVSASPSTGTWAAPDWTIGNLANGASTTLTMVARVNATGSYANTASIAGSQSDPTPGNNSGSATPTVNHSPTAVNDPYTVNEDNTVTLTPLSNDSDVDGNTISLVSINGTTLTGSAQSITVSNGTVNISGSGVISFTPTANFNSTTPVSIPYIITDGRLTATANILITVNAVNDAPVANNDGYTVLEGGTLTVTTAAGILSNDTDIDGDSLTAVLVSGPANGTLTLNANGSFTYVHDGSETITDSFTYRANDGTASSNIATVTITVTPVNDAPIAVNDAYTVLEGGTLTVTAANNILLNDTDAEGNTLTAVLVSGPANGSLTLNSNGTFTYVHNGSETTTDSFTYRANDGTASSNIATVTITVTPVNDAPVAVNDAYTVLEGGTLTVTAANNILLNDTDAENNTLTAALVSGPSNGTLTLNANGSFTYVHDGSETTTDSFTYRANDGTASSNIATVTITVTPVNDAPNAVNDAYTVLEGGTLTVTAANNILLNDTDAENNTLTAVLVSGPANGTLTLNSNGTFTYVHDGSETTTDSFTYRANDGTASSNIATVTITVTPVNDAPVAVNDAYTVLEGGTLTVTAANNILLNDTDAENNTLTAVLVSGPANGTLTLNANGSFTYVHDGNETTTDSFTYRANDGTASSNIATVTITVTPVNDAPVAVNDAYTVLEGGTLTVTAANNILLNDTDAENNTLTAVLVSGPANGTLTLNSNGTFTYVHDGSETTTDSFTYKVNDGTIDGNTATVTITVTPVNDAPIAVNDAYTVLEGGTLTVTAANNILLNDTDAEGNTLTAVLVSGPSNGTLTLNSNGTFTYVHDGSETITDSFTYRANDGTASSNIATVTITVTPVNDAPVAVNDAYTVLEGGTLTVTAANNILLNDTDAEGNTLTAVLVSGPSNGTLTLNANGSFTYVHDGSETTTDSFTYKVNDGTVDGNTATVTITVTPVNDAPVAVNDAYTVLEGGTLNVVTASGVLSNDTDAENNTLTAVLVSGPSNGTLTLNANGSFTYVHDGSETTTDSFTYKVNDGTIDGNTATVTITVTPVNDAPVANNDAYTVLEGGTLTVTAANNILLNDTDAEGNTLTAVLVLGPANGTLTLNSDGTFTYVHNGSETTTDSFTYRANDGTASSNIATVTITVTPVNDAPVAVNDAYTVLEGGTLNVVTASGVLSNDTDAENNTLTAVLVSGPSNGTLTLNANGSFTYVHDGSETSTDSFTYKVNDGTVDGNTATVTITVTPVNDAPVANNDAYTVLEGGTLNVVTASGVLSNDTDAENNTLTAVLVSGPANGTLTLNANGTFTYVHDGTETTTDSFTYKVNDGTIDGNTATVTITVTPVNDAPVANNDAYTVLEGGTLNVTAASGVLSNDTDAENNTLTAVLVLGPANGTLTLNSNGSFTYVHDGSETITDSFTYKVNDGTVDGNTATVTITVTPVNDAPVANNDAYTVLEGGTLNVTAVSGVLSNDTDAENNTLTAVLVSGPANGTLTLNANGSFTYVHDGSETTTDSFTYKVNDGTIDGNTATVTITVTPVNDAPVAVNDAYTVLEGGTLNVATASGVLSNDTDAENNTLTAVLVSGPANGTLTLNANGSFTYVHDGSETTTDSFTYKVNDGTVDGNTATVTITVTPVNDAPVAVNDAYTVLEGGTLNVATASGVLSNDTDAENNTLTAVLVSGPSNGILTLNANGSFTYVHDGSETSTDSFTYKVNDGTVDGNTATVTITVTPVNDAPVANNDAYTVLEGGTLNVSAANNILLNDTDAENNTLTAVLVSGPSNGTLTLNANGSFTYVHDGSETTTDSFTYRANDGTASSNTATVTITVTPVNDAPVANNDAYTVLEGGTLTVTAANNILLNDTDAEGNTLTAVLVSGPANGTLTLNANGSFTYVHDGSETITDSFTYKVNDGTVDGNTATVSITVTPVNDAPVAVNDAYTVLEGGTLNVIAASGVLSNDTDAENNTLTAVLVSGPSNGTLTLNANGSFTYVHDGSETTTDSFTYKVNDGTIDGNTATVTITVTPVNDAPIAVNDAYTVLEGGTLNVIAASGVLSNDTDAENNTLTAVLVSGPSNGTLTLNANGSFTYVHDGSETTTDSFTYKVNDGTVDGNTATVTITVTPVNDAPVAVNDAYTVLEGGTLNVTAASGVLLNDTDAENNTLTAVLVSGPSNGTLTLNANGSFTYVHDGSETITDSFTYKVNDGTVDGNTATVTITVTPVNDAPVANNDTNASIPSTANATSINALTATDVDGTIASYTIVTLPAHGTLALNGTAVTVNQILTPAEAGQLTYDPSGSFTGNDSFTFKATDDLGLDSAPAAITIVVGNNAPTANDDTNTGIPSSAAATAINALTATDTDGTVVNYIVLTLPSHGVLALAGNPIAVNQILTPTEAGMLTYDPSGAFSGNDSFTFTATDNNGAVDATPATITIPVVKRALVALKDEIGSVVGINEVVKVVNVLNNDTLDNNPLVISDVNLNVTTPDPNNVITLQPDGTVELIPNAPAGTYTLTYEICEKANSGNCTTASVSVTVVAPTMTINAESYCSNNAAYVAYSVKADNFTPTTLVTINWIDSANRVVATQTNMPLSGNVLWPGTIVDGNNRPTDWPGWVLTNGQWSEGADGFELTRPAVTMQFTLNPTQSVTVNYPAAASGCNAKPQFGIEAGNDDDIARADGINGSLEVINVLDNDKLNGVPVHPEDVILTGNNFPAGISLNTDGTIDVAPGTKGGSHTLTYQICEKANSNNCSTATVEIFVEVPAISLIMKVTSDDNNRNGAVEAGETLTYTFTVTNTGNVDLQNITISDLLPGVILHGGPINLAVGATDSTTFTATYTLTQADINAGMVSSQSTVTAISQSGITVDDKSDSENAGGDNPTVIEFNGCDIKIFNAISLNGDNMNERFYIRGIECYPDNTVQIFNRWGVLVFEREHYNNNDVVFKGYSEGRTTVKESNGLPEGTYYYILRYKDNQSKPRQEAGYLYLTK